MVGKVKLIVCLSFPNTKRPNHRSNRPFRLAALLQLLVLEKSQLPRDKLPNNAHDSSIHIRPALARNVQKPNP